MSDHTYVDVVPFKTTVLFSGDIDRLPKDMNPNLKSFLDAHSEGTHVTVCGWKYDTSYEKIGKKQRLYGEKLVKDEKVVYCLNEDEYSSGGGLTITFVAKKIKVLQEFCKDWGFAEPIEKDETAMEVM